MEKNITAAEAANLLGISIEKLSILEKQGLLHPTINIEGGNSYSSVEIGRIKSRHGLTLAEEAAQIGIQIQQEIVTSVSSLMKLRKRISIVGALMIAGLILSLIVITILFYIYPLATSDFFGYYYRFHAQGKSVASSLAAENKNVLGTSTGPEVTPVQTSILADVFQPVAATSLVLIKAVDSQKYQEITTNPVLETGLSGTTSVSRPVATPRAETRQTGSTSPRAAPATSATRSWTAT